MGEHLADQFLANLAAASFFALALKLSFVNMIPTALRLGAGCGISVLVSVLGLRSLGLLVSDSFTLLPFTWQNMVGLAIITASCAEVSNQANTKKWMIVIGTPMVLTLLVYAVADRSKFQGYSSAENAPMSNMGDGSFGLVDFGNLSGEESDQNWFYVVRTFLSIVINISSILLVLIDAVCLEEVHSKVKSSAEVDFSQAIGGTKKFRLMACAIPLMSCIGNLLGCTTQAAFVQSMILVFVGGRTGLSTVVTGIMFVLSAALWPLLPVLVPGHVSGALTVVITLRFLTVIRMIDVTRPSNLLMFGMSILLIPFSFDFVDALSIATVLGFLCESGNKLGRLWSARHGSSNKVAVSHAPMENQIGNPDADTGKTTSMKNVLERLTKTPSTSNHERLSGKQLRSQLDGQSTISGAETSSRTPPPIGQLPRIGSASPRNNLLPPLEEKYLARQPTFSPRGRDTIVSPGGSGGAERAPATPSAVHWGLALVAASELLLSVIQDQLLNKSDE